MNFSPRPVQQARSLEHAYRHCDDFVRQHDRDRWCATLFAPHDKRPALVALLAFNLETGRIREIVSDPLPGEVRLQWWGDLLEGEARGDAQAHPVAAALLDTIERYRLPRSAFLDLLEARVFDLYDDVMPHFAAFDGYCGETASAMIRLSSIVLADGSEPGCAALAGHAGVAYGTTGLLRMLPWHASRGQVYLPRDLLDRHGLTRDDLISGKRSAGLDAALAAMRQHARDALERVRSECCAIPHRIAPAFLPTSLVESHLVQMERPDYDPFHTIVSVPRWRKLMTMWRQSRLARASCRVS